MTEPVSSSCCKTRTPAQRQLPDRVFDLDNLTVGFLLLALIALVVYFGFFHEPSCLTYTEWLAYVDDAWKLTIDDRTVYLGIRKCPYGGSQWYLWEPVKDGRCTVIPAYTAQRLLILYGDPSKSIKQSVSPQDLEELEKQVRKGNS